jgi:hypothetical protein
MENLTEILQNQCTFLLVRPEDLNEIAICCVNRILEGQAKSVVPQDTEKPISQPEAIQFLGRSRQTLISWRKKGVITAYRLGGRIYYLKSELLAALIDHKKSGNNNGISAK